MSSETIYLAKIAGINVKIGKCEQKLMFCTSMVKSLGIFCFPS